MPVHRGERWIGAALQSLADEADEGIEVLVLDSSPDSASMDLVRSFEDRLAIRTIDAGENGMWHAKTNAAAAAARADHLCWLHQDDLWLPGRARSLRAWIAEDPEAVLHLAPSAIIDAAGRRRGTWRCPLGMDGLVEQGLLLERLLVQNFVGVPAPLMRKDAFLACGGLDETLWYTADWDLWLKLARRGRVRHHRAVTAAFRVHGSSLTVAGSHDGRDFERQMQVVLERHLPQLGAAAARVAPASNASIMINCALAAAAGGKLNGLVPAILRVLALGPAGLRRYLRDSRILERAWPRVWARLAGGL